MVVLQENSAFYQIINISSEHVKMSESSSQISVPSMNNITFRDDDKKEGTISRKRKKILNEIYETERTYQHHLTLLNALFLEPIRVSSVLPPNIIEGIFSNVEAIQRVSSHLLELMEEQGITQALIELAPFMKLYSLYANNFDSANKLLEEQEAKNANFRRLLKFQEKREEMQSLKFSALLVTPIQRVPRYRLLLQNLLEKTYEDDPDYDKLKDAFEKISRVTTHINECVRQHENFHRMLSIQNSFTGSTAPKILAPGRHFIREGIVTKVIGNCDRPQEKGAFQDVDVKFQITDRGNAKERTLFLFNDLLLCAKKETSCTYKCCDVLPLVNCIVEQVMGSQSSGNGLFKEKGTSQDVHVKNQILCKEKTLLLCNKLNENSWCVDIKSTISLLHSNLSSLRRLDNGSVAIRERRRGLDKIKSPSGKGFYSSSSRLRRLPIATTTKTTATTTTNQLSTQFSKRWTCPDFLNNNNEEFDVTKHDNFYKLSSSAVSDKYESSTVNYDEVFLKTHSNSSECASSSSSTTIDNPIINWTLSEPTEIESRRPLHSLKAGAKKLGCNSSTRRKQEKQTNTSTYSKEKRSLKRKSVSASVLTTIATTTSILDTKRPTRDGAILRRCNSGSADSNSGNGCLIM